MTSSHKCFNHAVGVVVEIIHYISLLFFHPVAEGGVDMETLVDDFVTFFIAGGMEYLSWLYA